MKIIDMELNIDDRVWVQEYDSDGEPLRLRYAKVLGIVPHEEKPPEVMVSYLDGRRKDECVPLEYVKEHCKKDYYSIRKSYGQTASMRLFPECEVPPRV